MKRKVVKHGLSTLTISLPSKWAKANKVKSGDLLELEVLKDRLVISWGGKKHFEEVETTFTVEEEWYIYRILRHLYTSGYDEIKINYSKKEHLELIRKGLSKVTGMEIVESSPKYCLLKCVVSAEDSDYEQIVNRLLWLIQSQFDYFIKDCKNGKPSMAREVEEIHKTVVRLNNLARRMINKMHLYDSVISKYVYWFLTSLLNISSFIVYSYECFVREGELRLTEGEFQLLNTVSDFYSSLVLAYKNKNINTTRKFFEEREALFDEVLEVLKEDNPIITHYFLDILKEMSSIGNLIISLGVNEKKEK